MVLTGKEILHRVSIGDIVISDFDEKRLNPNSYNLRLHNELMIYYEDEIKRLDYFENQGEAVIDMKKKNPLITINIPTNGFVLMPGILYLGRTVERTKTTGIVPQIQGRSSIGRLGIDVHKTAGWGDIGFDNYWTLEIVATQPVRIYPFIEICQIIYTMPYGDTSMVYKGKYQSTGQIDGSKLFEELKP